MTAKSELLLNELIAAAIAFGREREPDWQTRIEDARCELKTYVAELESGRRWIPVSERLPEANQDVLVFDRRGDITIDYLVAFNIEGVAYYTNADDGALFWMPLPQPPEVQE